MVEQQIFALDMESLANRMTSLQLDRIINLLNELWDEMCADNTERCTVEINCDEDGMEFTVGELQVPSFYFMKEDKFWCQLKYMLKSKVHSDHWFEVIMYQQFVNGWMDEQFTRWYLKRNGFVPPSNIK